MDGEVTVDALPYIDHGYHDPGVREAALSMLGEDHLPIDHLPINTSAFETLTVGYEVERIQNRIPMEYKTEFPEFTITSRS